MNLLNLKRSYICLPAFAVCWLVFVPAAENIDTDFKLPEIFCQNVSEVEIRFHNYYPIYLSRKTLGKRSVNDSGELEINDRSLLAEIISESVKNCCPNVTLSFVWLGANESGLSVPYLAQRAVFRHSVNRSNVDPKKFIFYFPEFSSTGAKEIYVNPTAFLPIVKSPGHAVIMLMSEAKIGLHANEIIRPSLPLLILMFASALVFGLIVWFLECWNNEKEFPRLFILGIFEGFWWSVVTMTTVGYGDKAPKNFLARCLAIAWMLCSYLLLSLVAANTTSIISTQLTSRIERTIGYKIGALNSKHFVEQEMNLGAEIVDFNNSQDMFQALYKKDIDRLLFPHYLHFLIMASNNSTLQDRLYVAKVLDQPFQLGLVLTHPVDIFNSYSSHRYFYYCLNSFTSRQPIKADHVDYSKINQLNEDIYLSFMDTSLALMLGKYMLYSLIPLVIFGLFVDFYTFINKQFAKKTKAKHAKLELNQVGHD